MEEMLAICIYLHHWRSWPVGQPDHSHYRSVRRSLACCITDQESDAIGAHRPALTGDTTVSLIGKYTWGSVILRMWLRTVFVIVASGINLLCTLPLACWILSQARMLELGINLPAQFMGIARLYPAQYARIRHALT